MTLVDPSYICLAYRPIDNVNVCLCYVFKVSMATAKLEVFFKLYLSIAFPKVLTIFFIKCSNRPTFSSVCQKSGHIALKMEIVITIVRLKCGIPLSLYTVTGLIKYDVHIAHKIKHMYRSDTTAVTDFIMNVSMSVILWEARMLALLDAGCFYCISRVLTLTMFRQNVSLCRQ